MGRLVTVVIGLLVLGSGLAAAAGPYHDIERYRRAASCEAIRADCLPAMQAVILDRRRVSEPSSDGRSSFYHAVTWERADGVRETQRVRSSFYRKVAKGESATLRLWRGQVVAIEAAGASQWFTPTSGYLFGVALLVAWLGLGVLLWGVLVAAWEGFDLTFERLIGWELLGAVPVSIAVMVLTYSLPTGLDLVFAGLGLLIVVVVGAGFLAG